MGFRERVLLVVCVDNIITGDHTHGIEELKTFLQGQFQTKDFGELRYFLGLRLSGQRRELTCPNRSMLWTFQQGLMGANL